MYALFARCTEWTPGTLTFYSEQASGHDSSLLLSIPPCLSVWKSVLAMVGQLCNIKRSSSNVVSLFILFFLETVIVSATADLLL